MFCLQRVFNIQIFKWLHDLKVSTSKRWINVTQEYTRLEKEDWREEKVTPQNLYQHLIAKGLLKSDSQQVAVIEKLNLLHKKLSGFDESVSTNFFRSLFSSRRSKVLSPRGLYLYGSVGCGKTMLMDIFYETIDIKKKKRIHFNSFMLDVHERIHRFKNSVPRLKYYDKSAKPLDPLPPVAKEIRDETDLLCFDEFQVTDVADAMILRRLFTCLFAEGVVMVSTSNRPPNDLYKNGLQRVNFLPFIPVLEQNCEVLHLKSILDYRRLDLSSLDMSYLVTDASTQYKIDKVFQLLCENEEGASYILSERTLNILGRDFVVKHSCGGVGRFTFEELCNEARGAVDYIAIAKEFHTVVVENIPVLSAKRKPELRRFITMIDNFYEYKVRIVCSAAKPIDELFEMSFRTNKDYNRQIMDDLGIQQTNDTDAFASLFTTEEENFAMHRTISRLSEMQTERYWNNKRQ